MEALLLTIAPVVTSILTGWVKGWTPFENLTSEARTPVVRFLAAAIALVYSLLTFWVTGHLDDGAFTVAVNTFLTTFLAWLGSLGAFHAFWKGR